MNVWLMAFIGGIFCTQIANPFFIRRFVKEGFLYLKKLKKGTGNQDCKKSTNRKTKVIFKPVKFWIQQIIFFWIGAIILGGIYYFGALDRTISLLIASIWFPGCLLIANSALCLTRDLIEKSFDIKVFAAGAYTGLCLAGISGGINIYSFHSCKSPIQTISYSNEVLDMNVLQNLKKELLIEGITLSEPQIRNDKAVMLMEKAEKDGILGYVIIEDNIPKIIPKELNYTYLHVGAHNVKCVARELLPTKIFFGNWSFQISDKGDLYFASLYGEYGLLRSSKNIQGIVLVNAETGECSSYTNSEIPSWIDGIFE